MDKTNRQIPSSFQVSVYGDLTPTDNPMLSKARLATFYRGKNRNRSFITDEVAAGMIRRAAGTPVVGVFDKDKDDFIAHAPVEQSQVYGHIPFNHNFAWEDRVDEDGIMRNYACFDVLLYTGRLSEASKIPGKKHSMELDEKTIGGQWKVSEGMELFIYDEAVLSGCCVLGEDYTPCFEGSSFFTHNNEEISTSAYLNTVREGVLDFLQQETPAKETEKQQIEGGTTRMNMNFGFAEGDVRIVLTEALNPNFAEDKGWLIEAVVLSANEGSCLSYNFEKQVYETHTYEIKEDGAISLDESATALEFYTFDTPEAREAVANELETAKAEFAAKQEEWEAEKATFESANAETEARIVELEESLAKYTAKDAELEEARKTELLQSYNTLLPEEELEVLAAEQSNFSYDELESKLAVNYVRAQRKETVKVPSGNFDKTPNDEKTLRELLSQYKK